MEKENLTDRAVMQLMALKRDLQGPYRKAFIQTWGEDVVNYWSDKIKKLIEVDQIEGKHRTMVEYLDIAEINVEDWYD